MLGQTGAIFQNWRHQFTSLPRRGHARRGFYFGDLRCNLRCGTDDAASSGSSPFRCSGLDSQRTSGRPSRRPQACRLLLDWRGPPFCPRTGLERHLLDFAGTPAARPWKSASCRVAATGASRVLTSRAGSRTLMQRPCASRIPTLRVGDSCRLGGAALFCLAMVKAELLRNKPPVLPRVRPPLLNASGASRADADVKSFVQSADF